MKALMSDGKPLTLRQIAEAVNGSEAGVSARLRDLRKERFGRHLIIAEPFINQPGLWASRLVA
jgi:hypothetical protein